MGRVNILITSKPVLPTCKLIALGGGHSKTTPSIGLIMGGKLYEPEGRIELATHDQTHLVRGWGRGRGLNMMACVSMFSKI